MNEKFFSLPKEKQESIISAGLAAFAAYGYQKAATEEIAKRAAISKALLFHYFESKKGLYLFLCDYAEDFVTREIENWNLGKEKDFFVRMYRLQSRKIELLAANRDIFSFLQKVEEESGDEPANDKKSVFMQGNPKKIYALLTDSDTGRLKNSLSMRQAADLIIWVSDGFLRSRTNTQLMNGKQLQKDYREQMELLYRLCCKKKYAEDKPF